MESLTIERSIYRLSSALAYRLTSRAALPLAVELEDLVLIESCRSLGITEKEMWIMSPGMFQSNDAIIEAYHCILEGFLFQLQLPMGEEPNTNEWWLRANMRGGGGGGVSSSFDPTSSNFGGSRSVLRSSYMSSHEFFSHFRPKNSDWKGLAARHDLLRRYKVVKAQPASTPRPSSSSSSTSLPITDGDETMEAAPQYINNTRDQIIPSSSSSSSSATTTTTTLATPTIITKLVYDFPSARVPSTVDDLLRIGGCSASQVEGLMTFITSASAGSSSSSFSTTLGGGGGGVSSESLPVMLDNTLTVLKEVKEFNIKTTKVIEAVRSLRGSSTSAENQLIKSMQLRRPLPSINDVFVSLSAKYQGGGGGGGGINSASQLSEFSRGGRGRGRGGRGRGGGARGGGIIAPGRKRGRPPSSSSTIPATGKRGGLSSSFSHSLVTSTSDKVKPSIIRFQSSALSYSSLSQSSLSQSALSQSALSQSALSQTRNEESGYHGSSVAVLSSTSFAGETGSSGGGRGGGEGEGGDDEVMNSAMNSGLSAGAASVVRTDGRGNDMELIEALFEETS
jgi:hypothetical protein